MNFYGFILKAISLFVSITFVNGLLPEAGRQRMQEHHGGDPEPADQFEQQLLTMFGLTKRPSPSGTKVIPRIMSHLYRAHMGDDSDGPHDLEDTWEQGFDLPHDDILKAVNTARGFHHIGNIHICLYREKRKYSYYPIITIVTSHCTSTVVHKTSAFVTNFKFAQF